MKTTPIQDFKIILTDNGQLDDLTISDCSLVRMEQMASGYWWLAFYRGDERISIFLHSKKKITATIAEDDLECVYRELG